MASWVLFAIVLRMHISFQSVQITNSSLEFALFNVTTAQVQQLYFPIVLVFPLAVPVAMVCLASGTGIRSSFAE